jgi:tyrosyl-tRNA synthetase
VLHLGLLMSAPPWWRLAGATNVRTLSNRTPHMSTTATTTDFLSELLWRGLLHQTTADAELRDHLAVPGRIAYCGFDPTSTSLTIGNFIPIKLLMHWQQHGHKPIVLMGGGTGLIGDPSGKEAERQLLSPEQVEANVAGQRRVFEKLLDFEPANPNAAVVVNNYDWLKGLGFIEVLRDVGKYFSVNAMIHRDAVRTRLESREQGISYTEFSYVILQAYDFLHLWRAAGCTVQMAGSDQYGNITAGIDLIRRVHAHDPGAPAPGGRAGSATEVGGATKLEPSGSESRSTVFGITAPLLLGADGKKIGKSESGAVYLTADRTSPYAFYQYWINVTDADVAAFLKWFTMLGPEEVQAVTDRHEAAPQERGAQRELARQMTRMIHGEEQLRAVEAASEALFQGDVRRLDEAMVAEVFADVPHSTHSKASLEGEGVSLVELLPVTTLASSRREAKDFLGSGSIAVNGERIAPDEADRRLTMRDLLHGRMILLKRGRKHWHATRWE